MRKTTGFLLAFCTLLIGLMVGASLAPAKKASMKIGNNNFFGIRLSFGIGKKRRPHKKLSPCCEAPAANAEELTAAEKTPSDEKTASENEG